MALLTRDSILQTDDLQREEVTVPEWGGHLFIRTMTGGERDVFDQVMARQNGALSKDASLRNIRATLVAMTACDDHGKLLFTPEDIEQLTQKSNRPLDRLFDVAKRLNPLSEKDIEELSGNS